MGDRRRIYRMLEGVGVKFVKRGKFVERVDRIRFPNGVVGDVRGNSIVVKLDNCEIELWFNSNFMDIEDFVLLYDTKENFRRYLRKDNTWTRMIQRDFERGYEGGGWVEWIKKWLIAKGCKILNYGNTYNFEYLGSVYEFVHFDHPKRGEGVVVMWHLGRDVRGNYSYPEVWFGEFEEMILSVELGSREEEKEKIAYELGFDGDWDALVDYVIDKLGE